MQNFIRHYWGLITGILILAAIAPFHQEILDFLSARKQDVVEWWDRSPGRDRDAGARIQEVNQAADIGAGVAVSGQSSSSGTGAANKTQERVRAAKQRDEMP